MGRTYTAAAAAAVVRVRHSSAELYVPRKPRATRLSSASGGGRTQLVGPVPAYLRHIFAAFLVFARNDMTHTVGRRGETEREKWERNRAREEGKNKRIKRRYIPTFILYLYCIRMPCRRRRETFPVVLFGGGGVADEWRPVGGAGGGVWPRVYKIEQYIILLY